MAKMYDFCHDGLGRWMRAIDKYTMFIMLGDSFARLLLTCAQSCHSCLDCLSSINLNAGSITAVFLGDWTTMFRNEQSSAGHTNGAKLRVRLQRGTPG